MAAADRNLCVVVNRLLDLLRCREVRQSGFFGDYEYQRLEETISRVAPLLLDAEKKSFVSYGVRQWVRDLGDVLHYAENILEGVKMISESDQALKRKNSRKSTVKKVAKKVSAILFSTSLSLRASPSLSLPRFSVVGIKLLDLANRHVRHDLVELSEKEIGVPAAAGSSFVDGWGIRDNYPSPLIQHCKDNYPLIDPFLKLSYDHLPSPLKHCFAYCSLFPIYYEIDVQCLTKLWMAQGFVAPPLKTTRGKFDKDLEDISYEYFLNLLRRSFFQDAKFDAMGRVTKCRMHHRVHNLATLVSYKMHDSSCPFHMSLVYLTVDHKDDLKSNQRGLRSLLFLTQRGGRPDYQISDWDKIFSRHRFLRALDMHACGIKTVPYSIGELKHLKYLDLSQNEDITELPDSITNLLNLQTLRLSLCFRLRRLPRDIGNLVNLRHLEYDGCYGMTSLPQGFGQLTNLRTLSQVVLSEDASKAVDELNELSQLSNLREVRIKNLRHRMGEQISKCLENMQRVRSLSLEWESREPDSDHNAQQLEDILSSHLEEFTLNGFRAISGFSFLPSSPTNLVKLSLKRLVKCKFLPPLDQCFKLKVLVLDEMTDLEYVSSDFSMQICPSLQELWLTELPKLKSWWTDGLQIPEFPSFPCLSRLVIEDCPNLNSMPLFPTLEEGLVLDSTSWELFRNTMKATVDEHKASSSTSTPSPPLSKLKNLCIVAIENFDNSKAEEISWATLKSLQMLKFDFLPEMKALPKGLQQVTRLRELHIWRCGTEETPEWIDKLKLLERLVIRECPNIKRLHANISLIELRTLEIENCPTLQRRCEEETGADWDKIAHVRKKLFGRISAK